MQSLIAKCKDFRDFDNHAMIVPLNDPDVGLKGFIAIHRFLGNNPAFGATRMACYKSPTEALKDAIRLSKLMSNKNIMANLPYGGAKTVLIQPANMTAEQKKYILIAFAKKVNELKGKYITGADLGISEQDLKIMSKNSPYMVGLKSQPVPFTALGLFYCLKASLEEVFDNSSLTDRTFAIQGLGKIGSSLLKLIYKEAKKIYVADVSHAILKNIKKQFPKVIAVQPKDIISQEVDVFAPCATHGVLNKESVKKLKCKMVVGGANNQLDCPATGALLFKRGILYAPDYIVNAGGVISVADEYHNPHFSKTKLEAKVRIVADTLKNIYDLSRRQHKPTNIVADELAKAMLNKKYAKQPLIARV